MAFAADTHPHADFLSGARQLAAVWRAQAVGIYRLWRDGGFAVGALLAGVLADLFSIRTAVWAVAALTAASGLLVAARMYETHHPSTIQR